MKATDALAALLAKHVRHVFCISGGASLHIIHSIASRNDIKIVCPQNEQAAGFQADCYARLAGLGCALATSGPGASNLITAIASSFYDSVPVLYITGNQTRSRMVGDSGCRQIGFQETPICDIVAKITKGAVTVMDARELVPTAERLIALAHAGRKGPVLLDIPDDVQRENI